MIVNIRHKGLKLFYEKGDHSKLPSGQIKKIRLILTRLDSIMGTSEMNVPGYFLHRLTGELREYWSVRVDKNNRIIFRVVFGDVYDVDYIDYH